MLPSDIHRVVATSSCFFPLSPHFLPPLRNSLQNKGKHNPKIKRRRSIYNWTNFYLWTAIPYYNKKVCKHTYTHMESGLNQSYVQKAGGYSREINS